MATNEQENKRIQAAKDAYSAVAGQQQTSTQAVSGGQAPSQSGSQNAGIGGQVQNAGRAATSAPQTQPVTYVENGERKTGYADNYYSDQQNADREAYQRALEQNQQSAQAAEEQVRQSAQDQKDALASGYQDTARQLYRDYLEKQKALPQQLAAAGYTGGLSESSRVRLGNSYEETLAENERARRQQELSIDSEASRAIYEAAQAKAAADRQAYRDQLSQKAALRAQEHEENLSERDYQRALERSDYEYKRALERADYEYGRSREDALADTADQRAYQAELYRQQLERADLEYGRSREDARADTEDARAYQAELYRQQLERADYEYGRDVDRQDMQARAATLGASGDFSGYAAMGYSQDQIDYMTRVWLTANPDYAGAWAAAHPKDAVRLGIGAGAGGGYSGGGSGGGSSGVGAYVKKAAEIIKGNYSDYAEAANRIAATGDVGTVREMTAEAVKKGEITEDQKKAVDNAALEYARRVGNAAARRKSGGTTSSKSPALNVGTYFDGYDIF